MPVAYITGATSGIGRATAERFIEEGWTVVAMARREERLQELQDAHPGSVHCFKLDVRDKAAVEHVFSEAKERFGAPDVLVNNAGLALGLEPAQACSLDDWDTMVDTNIKGLLYCTRAALPGMVERHSGHVVNLGSIAGTYVKHKPLPASLQALYIHAVVLCQSYHVLVQPESLLWMPSHQTNVKRWFLEHLLLYWYIQLSPEFSLLPVMFHNYEYASLLLILHQITVLEM